MLVQVDQLGSAFDGAECGFLHSLRVVRQRLIRCGCDPGPMTGQAGGYRPLMSLQGRFHPPLQAGVLQKNLGCIQQWELSWLTLD